MAASILLPGPTLPILSTNIDRQMDLFSKITCHFPELFLARFLPKLLLTFFGHSLLSYSKRRHLSTSRVIPRPLSYHSYHMMTSYDTASICQSMLVENASAWRSYFQGIRSCQNPIGRASTQNCKLWLFHIK